SAVMCAAALAKSGWVIGKPDKVGRAQSTRPIGAGPLRTQPLRTQTLSRSHLDLLVLERALHRRPRHHAILERGVVLELAHWQLAAHTPGVEHERVGIDHGVLVAYPFASGEPAVDLLQVTVEGLEPGLLDQRIGRGIGGVALGPADM